MKELGIVHQTSSTYHPESQGALERFHQTLKNMLRTYCFDHGKDWDEGVPLLLFASREITQESLGFSPFELIFGHTVRGPLKLLKDQWLESEIKKDVLSYVVSFREKLQDVRKVARDNLEKAQEKMKEHYDRKATLREFKIGDKVLAMLLIPGSPLKARFHGPYVVTKKVGDLDYEIDTPDRRKQKQLCHVNMLKLYNERETEGEAKPVANTVKLDSKAHVCNDNEIENNIGISGNLKTHRF